MWLDVQVDEVGQGHSIHIDYGPYSRPEAVTTDLSKGVSHI